MLICTITLSKSTRCCLWAPAAGEKGSVMWLLYNIVPLMHQYAVFFMSTWWQQRFKHEHHRHALPMHLCSKKAHYRSRNRWKSKECFKMVVIDDSPSWMIIKTRLIRVWWNSRMISLNFPLVPPVAPIFRLWLPNKCLIMNYEIVAKMHTHRVRTHTSPTLKTFTIRSEGQTSH